MRLAHRIRGNKSSESPQSCVWFDTETDAFEVSPTEQGQRLNFGWACHQLRRTGGTWTEPVWLRFVTPESFFQWLESRTREKTRTYVFGHNLHFESTVLNMFAVLPSMGWESTRVIVESPPFIARWRKGKKTLEFLDTGNWWLHSAAKIGKTVGVPKLVMPPKDAARTDWDTYCRNDVEIIRVACLKWFEFLQRYDLGGFSRTLAGQSYRSYRHRFMSHDIFVEDHIRSLALGRSAYHGGRTECFFIGRLKGPVFCYDVNSMYPFVMKNELYPVNKVHYGHIPTLKELRLWVREFAVVADVEIETDEPRYAYVWQKKIIFPVGRFRVSLTTPDLETALEHNHIRQTFAYAAYQKAPIFSRFVDALYQLRLEAKAAGDDVMTYNLKILLNSLYGKFGQTGRIWETVGRCDSTDLEVWDEVDDTTGRVYSWRKFGGIIQVKKQEPESFESFPAIAAHVTAYARRQLWSIFKLAGRQNVFYCDTDSVYVNLEGSRRLQPVCDDSALGALKLEKTLDWLTIRGPKDYESPEGKTVKGVKATAKWLDGSTVEQEEWSKLPGLLRRGIINTPIIRHKVKRLKRIYDKGIVTRSGWVEPFRLPFG